MTTASPLPPAIARFADSVAYRLETPRLKESQVSSKAARASDSLRGFIDRRLSPHDREEVASACILALVQSGEIQIATLCPLYRPSYTGAVIPAFQLARQTLQMGESDHSRKLASFSLDAHLSTEDDLPAQDAVMIRASLEHGKRTLSRSEQKWNPHRAKLAALFARLRQLAKLARKLDTSRKARFRYKTARSLIYFATKAANGGPLGDWLELSKATRSEAVSNLRAYLKPAISHLASEQAASEQAASEQAAQAASEQAAREQAAREQAARIENLPLAEAMAALF